MKHTTGTFMNAQGQSLFHQHWLPDGAPAAGIALVHGYAEHSGRYDYVARALVRSGFAVHALDLRGHGRSEGKRVLVRSFNEHLDDVELFLAGLREDDPATPLFLLGHSMGGTISALACIVRRPEVDGVLLSGAGLTLGRRTGWFAIRFALIVGWLLPRLKLRALDAATVSRDPAVVALYDSDPLNYRGKMPAGTMAAMIRALQTIERRMEAIDQPLLVMHGTEDALTSPAGSEALVERASSTDKTLRLYEGLFHEILNEPERDQVLADITGWLSARVPATVENRTRA